MPESPPCPSCGRGPVDPRWRPFCSERCKLIDLGRWLSDGYRIPGEAADPSPDDEDGSRDAEREQ